MATQTIKHLTVEAVLPDGTINGKTLGARVDDPEDLLSGMERMQREAMQREYPGAEVSSSGWLTGDVIVSDQD